VLWEHGWKSDLDSFQNLKGIFTYLGAAFQHLACWHTRDGTNDKEDKDNSDFDKATTMRSLIRARDSSYNNIYNCYLNGCWNRCLTNGKEYVEV
jgi:hypothetical protein